MDRARPGDVHSLGVFTATFIYSMAAIAWLDRDRSGKVLFFSGWLVVGLLLASVGMFIALVDRVAVLQINSMLTFTGDHGRSVIERTYPPLGRRLRMRIRKNSRTVR